MQIQIILLTWYQVEVRGTTHSRPVTESKNLINKMEPQAQLAKTAATIDKVQQPINRKRRAEVMVTTRLRNQAQLSSRQEWVTLLPSLTQQHHLRVLRAAR